MTCKSGNASRACSTKGIERVGLIYGDSITLDRA
ncbi:hypothetical protein J471_4786, partial [Acinetobacter baumannii 1032359]